MIGRNKIKILSFSSRKSDLPQHWCLSAAGVVLCDVFSLNVETDERHLKETRVLESVYKARTQPVIFNNICTLVCVFL